MSCQHVQSVITDALAAGAQLPREVSAHADGCPACRAALEQELALFSALDAGLRSQASAEVPADFLPRMRARIAEARAPRPLLFPAWAGVFSMAALALVIALVIRLHHSVPGAPGVDTPPVAVVVRPGGSVPGGARPHEKTASPPEAARRNSHLYGVTAARSSGQAAEVIVSREDLLALARLVRRMELSGSPHSRALAAPLVPEADLAPIADLRILQLEVKPLESGAAESGAGEQ